MDTLTGKLLIAMPGMMDPRFAHSVVFLWEHSPRRTLGLIVNKPSAEIESTDLLEQLGVEHESGMHRMQVHYGGPVETSRGFVLHSRDYDTNSTTVAVTDEIGMTATLDILQDIAAGRGPSKAILALGYSGWGPGQLEGEIQGNGWLTAESTSSLVFGTDADEMWLAALKSLGVDAIALSSEAGHA